MNHSASEKRVLVGELTAPFGVRGEVKMRPLLENPRILTRLPAVQVRFASGSTVMHRVVSIRPHQPGYVVQFEGVVDRNATELLRGAGVYILEAELPPLPDGEYYEHQLLGLRIVTDTGRDLGPIEKVHFYPANDVYETPDVMIPAVEGEYILAVDLTAGIMTVRDVEGLEK